MDSHPVGLWIGWLHPRYRSSQPCPALFFCPKWNSEGNQALHSTWTKRGKKVQTGEAVKCSVTILAFNVSKAKIDFHVEQGLSMLSFMKQFFKAQSNLSAPNIVGHLWCGMAPFAVFLRHKRKKGGAQWLLLVTMR